MAIWQVCSTWWAIMNSYWYQFQTIWTGWWLFHANPPTTATTCLIPVWFPGNVGPHNTWCTFQTMARTAVFVAIDGQVVIVLLRTKIHDSNHREWPQRYLTLLRCTIWLGKMRAREASAFDLTRLWRLLFPQTSQSGTIPRRWHRPARLVSFTSVISLMSFTNLVRLMSFTTVVNLISLISSTSSPRSLGWVPAYSYSAWDVSADSPVLASLRQKPNNAATLDFSKVGHRGIVTLWFLKLHEFTFHIAKSHVYQLQTWSKLSMFLFVYPEKILEVCFCFPICKKKT